MSSWHKLLGRYNEFAKEFDVVPCLPATTEDFQALEGAADKMSLHLEPELYEFLSISNGTSFDGLRFYGANIKDDDEAGRFDFATANSLIEERGDDTLYGEWQDEFFVRVRETGKFERRSKVTGDSYDSYDSYRTLLEAVLGEECALLETRFGSDAGTP